MDDIEDYKKLLMRKIDHEIPRAIEETLAKHAYLIQHKKNLELEIERLEHQKQSRGILDIPLVAWEKIIENCANPAREVMRLCLASSKLEQIITQGVWRDRVKLIGVNVFALLLQRVYLDREDIMNCQKTGNRLVETLAITSWRHFDNSDFDDSIKRINSEVDLENLLAEVRKSEISGFQWKHFLGKRVSICRTNGRRSPRLWSRITEFLRQYGKFISVIDILQDCDDEKIPAIKREWFPQLQTLDFKIYQGGKQGVSSINISNMFEETFNENLVCVRANPRNVLIQSFCKTFFEIADKYHVESEERLFKGNFECLNE